MLILQALSKKEDGVLLKTIPEQALKKYCDQMDVDKSFDITHNITFLPFVLKLKEEYGRDTLQSKEVTESLHSFVCTLENT